METQEFQTETGSLESETEQKKEENGLDTFLYVREKENTAGDEEEKITVRKVTLGESGYRCKSSGRKGTGEND